MRNKIIAGNWKMNKTVTEAIAMIEELKEKNLSKDVDTVVCVPYTHLFPLKELLKDTTIKLGAQNMYYEEEGAFTGEISPLMLKDLGVEYVILGHSERRTIFKEDDTLINKKLKSALEHNFKPILCVGEKLEEREGGKVEEVLGNQLKKAFEGIEESEAEKVIVAYEPIWAIGTGKTASDEDANSTIGYVRQVLGELYSQDFSEKVRIQYGGSVKPKNIKGLMAMEHIDGALVAVPA